MLCFLFCDKEVGTNGGGRASDTWRVQAMAVFFAQQQEQQRRERANGTAPNAAAHKRAPPRAERGEAQADQQKKPANKPHPHEALRVCARIPSLAAQGACNAGQCTPLGLLAQHSSTSAAAPQQQQQQWRQQPRAAAKKERNSAQRTVQNCCHNKSSAGARGRVRAWRCAWRRRRLGGQNHLRWGRRNGSSAREGRVRPAAGGP